MNFGVPQLSPTFKQEVHQIPALGSINNTAAKPRKFNLQIPPIPKEFEIDLEDKEKPLIFRIIYGMEKHFPHINIKNVNLTVYI